jgi:hypothetical protein
MGSIWLLSGPDKPPARPRKPPAKRPTRGGTGTKSRPAGKARSDKPKPARRKTNAYQMEIKALAETTAALPPDFRDAVVRAVQGLVDLFKRAWRALRSGGLRGEAPPHPRGRPPHQQE